jgi:hypothetical protein
VKIAASRATVERLVAVVTLASSIEQVDDIRSLNELIRDQPRDELEELALVLSVIVSRTSNPELVRKMAFDVASNGDTRAFIL